MSLFDVLQRANAVLKKYEKYDQENKKHHGKASDPFTEEVQDVEAEIARLMSAAQDVSADNNRAAIAAKNAEIRRIKNVLLNEAIESLQKNVKKGKGVNKEIIKDRQRQISDLIDKIYAIPDGMHSNANKRPTRYGAGKSDKGSKKNPVMLDIEGKGADKVEANPGYYAETEDTMAFDKHWREAKRRQDEQLGRIEMGVDRLGEMARNIQDEVDRQDPVIDDIDHQINKVTTTIRNNNAKLKGLIHKMRSARNFCVDVILILLLLGIGAYMYSMFAPKK
mmetsp:Transcript_36932/g.82118  ORF Transcript_36932/g.82118 Transcript_36932/m.82118 type:complete len:279 (+) Transcript_36932:235-1071(+)